MTFKAITMSVLLSTFAASSQTMPLTYPAAPADGTVYDCFGMKVSDNYRPLENDTAAATVEWVNAENALTQSYLSQIPFRSAIAEQLTDLYNFAKVGLPWKGKDGLYYHSANDGLRNQSVIYRGTKPFAEDAEVFLDPNTLSEDGTVALTGLFQSHDGKYTAYTISRSGSDWTEIFVMETATRRLLDDHIEWAKFTSAAWDGEGFYYSAYPRPEAGKEFSNANEYHTVYYHRLGTSQDEDVVAYENREQPLYFHQVQVTNDCKYLAIYGGGQGFGNSLYVKKICDKDAQWITIEESQDCVLSIIDVLADGRLLVFTSVDAPCNRVVIIDPEKPARENWQNLIPESPNAVLTNVEVTDGDKLIAVYERDASTHASLYNIDGTLIREITFPTYGTAGFSVDRDSADIFYAFTSFTYPSSIYSYDAATGESTLLKDTQVKGLVPGDYVTEQVFYTSKDGTRVPMFLVYKKGVERSGNNPTYLYGYGGFNVSLTPSFTPWRLLWLDNGGIYALANLRGGAEYGEVWHEAGTKMKKQNVFDDFISAGEYLIAEGWTCPERLVIEGGSNGGLLVGAVVNQRPDLFSVAIPRVGVMDMMRYHLFTIGWNWASDYGTADESAEMAAYLLNYSPIHNIRTDGTPYPAIMVTTADHDDRVVPAHSFKYAATLQAANTGERPKLIRIDSKAGHGAGKPISKIIDEWTDILSFIYFNLGLTPQTR